MCSENVYICVNVKNQAQLKLESIDFLKKIPNFLTFKDKSRKNRSSLNIALSNDSIFFFHAADSSNFNFYL